MRARDLIPFVLIGGIAVFIVQQRRSMKPAPTPPAAAPAQRQDPAQPPPEQPVAAGVTSQPADPARDAADARLRLDQGAPGTYILDILSQQEQTLIRWPDRSVNALRVWIERWSDVANWDRNYPIVAEAAFTEWRAAGFPMRFDIVVDSVGADIKIIWSNKFSEGGRQIGVTQKMRDQNGWIRRADIIIATHNTQGAALAPATIAGVVRHEVGHALGLGHSPSKNDVMYPESYATTISEQDRATLHLLYTLPPGVVK